MSAPRAIGRVATRLVAIGLLIWTAFFVWQAFFVPFPLDGFEDYELWHSTRLLEGHSLYEPPGKELFPTPYPPGYYLSAATAQKLTGRSDYLPGRLVSLLSFLTWTTFCYLAARKTGPLPVLAVAVLVAIGYRGAARYYTIARPDMLMAGLLGIALTLGPRRRRLSVVLAGVFAALAVYCKQTALPVALAAILLVPPGRRLTYVAAFGLAGISLAVSFLALGGIRPAWHWCVLWPASHGFSLYRAFGTCMENWETSLAVLVLPLVLLTVAQAPMRAVAFSCASSLATFVALGKWGAIENHFLVALVPQAVLIGRYRPSGQLAYAAGVLAMLTLALGQLPDARELHWLATRREEVRTWANAVRDLDAGVAHYAVLGTTQGAPFAEFSDLALKLPAYVPPSSLFETIVSEMPPVVVLSADPTEWNSPALARLFLSKYNFRGKLDFKRRSGVLPSLVFERVTSMPTSAGAASEAGHGLRSRVEVARAAARTGEDLRANKGAKPTSR